MATGFEKLQSALDLSKFEDLFTSRKQLVLGKLGLGDKANIFQDKTIFNAIKSLSSLIASAPNDEETIQEVIQNSVNAPLNKPFWLRFDPTDGYLPDLSHDVEPELRDPIKPEVTIEKLKQAAQSFQNALLEITLEDIHQKRAKFAKEYEEKFKEFNNLDRIALYNAVKIKDSEQVTNFNNSYAALKAQIEQLEWMPNFIVANFKNTKLEKQAEKELELIQLNLIESQKVKDKMKAIKGIMKTAENNDYLALENSVTYTVKTQEQYQDYLSKTNGNEKTKVSSGLPEEREIKYLEVEKRKDNQLGLFEKKYPGKEVSRYSLEGDASDPHWSSVDCPKDEKLLAEHTTRWAIDIIRQNGLPTQKRPLYIEEGSKNPEESKFLVIALMKVLKITSKDEANLLIKTDHTDWKPSDELSLIGGGFGRFSTYNSAFKDNKDVQKILANFENKNVVEMEEGKDFSYIERNEPALEKQKDMKNILNEKRNVDQDGNDWGSEYSDDSDSEEDVDAELRKKGKIMRL